MDICNTYVNIDLDAILANFRAIRQKAGVPVLAVVKADAYGHGAVPVAQTLEPECAFFGVATVSEAQQLRQAGIKKPILILSHTPTEAFPRIIGQNIRPAIYRWEDALALSEAAQALGITAPFHFALDTGMSRIGFQANDEDLALCIRIASLPNLHAEGIFTHFAKSDEKDLTSARQQAAMFDAFIRQLSNAGVQIPLRHIDNSAGILNFDSHYDMVRAGIVTYGLYPSRDVDLSSLALTPAMSWYSRVCHVKWLQPGRQIGYGGAFTVTEPIKVATVCVGYADGYRRSLSGNFYVLIRGKKAPILGRVCMDQMMVDVTDIPEADINDPVLLMGADASGAIPAEVLAEACGSFHYELLCTVGHRCPRHYYKNGVCVKTKDYLL